VIFVTQFIEKIGIKDQLWIEAISSCLFECFCEKIPYDAMVPDVKAINDLFFRLSEFISQKDPKISKALNKQKLNPHQYALSWFLSLFSEQHKNDESLLIFDHILLHLNNLDDYMFALSLAHLKQIQFGSQPYETVQFILNKILY